MVTVVVNCNRLRQGSRDKDGRPGTESDVGLGRTLDKCGQFLKDEFGRWTSRISKKWTEADAGRNPYREPKSKDEHEGYVLGLSQDVDDCQ